MDTKEEKIERVKTFMKKHKLTNETLAEKTGTTRGEISRKLRGDRKFSSTFMVCLSCQEAYKKLTGEFLSWEK